MTENTEIQTFKIMSPNDMKNRYTQFVDFSKSILKENLDYWKIPWVSKPSLLKPGAEKLRVAYGLWIEIERTGDTLDLTKDFYDVNYIATVVDKSWRKLAQCEWSANTLEDKYRYTRAATDKKPSKEEAEKLKALKIWKWSKSWSDWVWLEKTEAKNRISLKNTIQKMAQKRAFVGAILIATGASEFFTQDVEDMSIGGNVVEPEEVKEEKKSETSTTNTPTEQPTKRFNEPEIKALSENVAYIKSFKTSEDLINDISKKYRISKDRKMEIADIWADNYEEGEVVEEQVPEESSKEEILNSIAENSDELPF